MSRSVAIVSPAKTAKPIDMPFWAWTLVDPRNHVLDGRLYLVFINEFGAI